MELSVLRCWWLALVMLAACFSPQFEDGQIKCGPNGECPPGLDCYGGVCRTSDPGPDAATGFPLTVVLGGNMMGTVTSAPGGINCGTDCSETFDAGTMVTLTATPTSGSVFVGWSGACSGTGTCTVTVATAITVTANFAVDNSLVVAVTGNGSGVVSSNPAGINCGIDCMEQFPPNTVVVLTASPATGSQFDGWSGGGCSGTGTCMVTADVAKMVTASFSLTEHALTVLHAGNGAGTVTSTPDGIDCGVDCSESYPYNTMVTLSAVPETGSTFAGWAGGGCTGTGTCQVTMTQATSVTARFTLTSHVLMVMKAGNGDGTVTATGISCGSDCMESYDYGTMVTLSAMPSPGSTFTGWSGGGCSGTASCIVPITQATSVTATFTLNSYTLTVAKSGNGNGTVSSTGIDCGADCSESFNYGTMVTLTAMAATGSTFTGWSGGGCNGTGSCTVTLAASTTVTATFELTKHDLTVTAMGTGSGSITGVGINCGADCTETYDYNTVVTLTASPAAGSSFAGWQGGGCSGTGQCQVTMTQATSVSATFTLSTHVLTVTKSGTGGGTVASTPSGIDCGADCNQTYDYDTVVTLTATPAPGSVFGGWSGGGCTGTLATCQVTMQTATTVTATFTLTSHVLSVTRVGAGSVSSNIPGIACPGDCSESYTYGTFVTLTAVADSGWTFTGWSGGNCSGTGTCEVTVEAATNVTATFTVGTAALSVTKDGTGSGTVTSDIAGINCGADCNEDYANNTTVVLTATPAPGSTFSGWSGGGCTGTGPCTVTTSGTAINVTATFTITVHNLSVTMDGTGVGTVQSTDSLINCGSDCSQAYSYGTDVTLVAQAGLNSTFTGWSGGGCSGTGTCVVDVTMATSVTATFDLVPYYLTVKPVGNGFGTVTSNPMGIDCGADCEEAFDAGQTVTLTAVAAAGSTFIGWDGDCAHAGTNVMCTVTMSGDLVAAPQFAIQQYRLRVDRNPLAGGDVYSINDATIDCGSDCDELYDYNTVVPLKPSPAAGYTFTGWSGACSGNGDCDVTMDADKTVTANFVLTTYTLTVNLGGNGNGTVSSTPAGISCSPTPGSDCSHVYTENTMVQLTPSTATGTMFGGWTGCTSVVGTTCNVTMNAAKSVTATFNLQTFTLAVSKMGSGSGTVTSNPTGINCGTTCNNTFNYGTNIQLTASPAAGSTFTSWSGCNSTSGQVCNVTITGNRNVTPVFTAIPPNYVFVTSTTHTGSLGGLTGADTICQTRASAAGLSGTYRAWLSTSTVDAYTRLGSARGWIRPDGKPVADKVGDLTSGHLFYPPRLDENGTAITTDDVVYTATGSNGKLFTLYTTCSDWTSASSTMSAERGEINANSSMFSVFGPMSCAGSARLLCFGIDNQAVVAPPAQTTRTAFTTDAYWLPGGGIASADALCAQEATAAGLSGSYKALLATTTSSAIARFTTTAASRPWARRDHTLVTAAASTLALATLTYVDASPNSNASGTTWFGNSGLWTGAATLTSLGTATTTCNNWTSNAAADTGRGGRAGFSKIADWWGMDAAVACSATSRKLVCLEE